MIHGGDLLTYKDICKGEISDYSSNINPLGPPSGLKDVLFKAYDELISYPDIQYRELRGHISEYLGCMSDEVIVGNGAVEIISSVTLMFKRVVVFVPCFIEYIKRPLTFGKEVLRIKLNEDFNIDIDALYENLRSGDLLLLGNPNNPTGYRISKDTLVKIYEIVNKRGAFLLLDEAFFEFCPPDYDSIKLFKGCRNVCVIRAATKFFALPGIRLGYAFANADFAKNYRKIESPWSVNSFANAAARHIFKDSEYIRETKEYIQKERQYMLSQLSKIQNIRLFETSTNYILIKLKNHNEDYIFNEFLKRGILVRKASTFEGLDKSFIRIAVKDRENNIRVINCFKECL